MSAPPLAREERLAALALRLLLGERVSTDGLVDVDWSRLAVLAEQNGVLVRLADRLAAQGVHPPRRFTAPAEQERARARVALEVLAQVHAAGVRHGVEWLLPKAGDRFPDLGDDLDLLTLAQTDAVDRSLLEGIAVTPQRPTLAHRLAGSTVYGVVGADLVLDIRHGRLGHAGQYAAYAARLFRTRRPVAFGGLACATPAPEDQLVLQGVEKVVARRTFHFTDVLTTIATIRRRDLDWPYVIATARALGVRGGLSCYLQLFHDVHARLLGGELLARDTRRALGPRLSRHARVDGAGVHCSALWVTGRVHVRQLAGALVSGDWAAAGRLGLWPLAALGARLRRHTATFHAWPQAAEAGTS
jgi:putative nucleotidyltransferase-like protein